MTRVRLIHEWLVRRAGSERVVEALLELCPAAPLHALVYDPRPFRTSIIGRTAVQTSFIQRLPGAVHHYQHYMPLMPLAVEQFDVSDADMIISSHHAVAKGVLTRADQLHVCYVHAPMRYAWDLHHQYVNEAGRLRGLLARVALHGLRRWDVATANRVDLFVANSHATARRIWRAYRRPARVIYPPVDVSAFTPRHEREPFFLVLSRLVPYKRVDIVVAALTRLGLPLVVIGEGPERGRLQNTAGPSVRFLGWQPDRVVRDHLERARALLFAGEEDFGIVPVEAQAAGCPVIAYGRGGVLESVVAGTTGLFFAEQSAAAVAAAVDRFNAGPRPAIADLRTNVDRFSTARFRDEMAALLARAQTLRGEPVRLERELASPAAGPPPPNSGGVC